MAPRLSVARVLSEYVPAATAVQVNVHGAAVREPTAAPFARNSTRVTVPSLSNASATMAIVAGAVKCAFAPGLVRRVVGGMFATSGAVRIVVSFFVVPGDFER